MQPLGSKHPNKLHGLVGVPALRAKGRPKGDHRAVRRAGVLVHQDPISRNRDPASKGRGSGHGLRVSGPARGWHPAPHLAEPLAPCKGQPAAVNKLRHLNGIVAPGARIGVPVAARVPHGDHRVVASVVPAPREGRKQEGRKPAKAGVKAGVPKGVPRGVPWGDHRGCHKDRAGVVARMPGHRRDRAGAADLPAARTPGHRSDPAGVAVLPAARMAEASGRAGAAARQRRVAPQRLKAGPGHGHSVPRRAAGSKATAAGRKAKVGHVVARAVAVGTVPQWADKGPARVVAAAKVRPARAGVVASVGAAVKRELKAGLKKTRPLRLMIQRKRSEPTSLCPPTACRTPERLAHRAREDAVAWRAIPARQRR